MKLQTVLTRSEALHQALREAVGAVEVNAADQRASVAMDALMVAAQHGEALRTLLSMDLGVSGVAMLRLQYEAVLRAVWVLWVAAPSDLAALSAPLTPATTKAANSLGLAGQLLGSVLSAAIANKLPEPGTIFLAQGLRFTAPVRPGDTVRATVSVKEVMREKRRVALTTVCTVEGNVVLDGGR